MGAIGIHLKNTSAIVRRTTEVELQTSLPVERFEPFRQSPYHIDEFTYTEFMGTTGPTPKWKYGRLEGKD
jgi:hypothetical protein